MTPVLNLQERVGARKKTSSLFFTASAQGSTQRRRAKLRPLVYQRDSIQFNLRAD